MIRAEVIAESYKALSTRLCSPGYVVELKTLSFKKLNITLHSSLDIGVKSFSCDV